MYEKIIVLILCAGVCSAYVMIEPSKTGNGKCVSKIYPLGVMNFGEERNVPNDCMRARCGEGGNISYEGCSVVGLPSNCKFIEPDPKQPFPNCCKYDYVCGKE